MNFFKSVTFKVICAIAGLLLVGMIIAALFDTSASAQSSILGAVFYPAEKLSSVLSEKICHLKDNVSGKSSYREQINELNLEIADLQKKLVDYDNMKRENEYYQDFLEVKEEHTDFKMEKADIIARDSEYPYSSFTIGVGSKDSVRVNDCVIYGKYLVGVVTKVYLTTSVVKTITDPSVSVSVYEASTGEISFTGSTAKLAKDGKLMMKNLKKNTQITQNGIICTSGIGGVYPKDLILGTVDSVGPSSEDVSYVAQITPSVDSEELTNVFVVTNFAGKGVSDNQDSEKD